MEAQFSAGTLKQLNLFTDSQISQCRSKRIYILLGILVGIFAISTAVSTVILAMKDSKKTGTIANHELCVTPYCVKAANYLIESIDETVEPCEDFYHFACGTWIKKTRIPDDAGAANTFSLLRTQLDYNIVDILTPSPTNDSTEPKAIINARVLYHSCINEENIEKEGIDTILSLINKEFGGWPILQGSSWNNSNFNLLNLLLKLRQYSTNIIFSVSTLIDDKHSTKYDTVIGQSGLGLSEPIYYFSQPKLANRYQRLITYVASGLSNDTSTMVQDAKDIFEFEKQIAIIQYKNQIEKYYWATTDPQRVLYIPIVTTVGNLSRLLNTTFNFTNYLHSAFSWAGIDLLDNDIVTIDTLDYLYQISLIIDQTSSRTLQNYVIWLFIWNQIDNMPKRFRIGDTITKTTRTITCGKYVNQNMGFAVSKVYIKKYFDYNARNQSLEMIRNIRKAWIDMLNQSTWMDDMSKSKAIEKAEAIDEKIGYPDYLASDNVTQLETEYAEYIFNSSHINNVLKLLQIKAKEEFQNFRKPIDHKVWGSTPPTDINAYYSLSKNQITFPAGILQMPFFDKDAPKYLNYGGIGAIIGHEITHGFDNNGWQFDKDGNQIPWWTNETEEQFIQRKTCIIDQYNNYTEDGDKTQGEDIADNGGLRKAFFAYQKWAKDNPNVDKRLPGLSKYSPEQMFFINYAHSWCSKMTDLSAVSRASSNVHSLEQFRVLGPTSNFAEFDRVFNCKPGQGNSRVNKCIVW
ncbi:unnamed protein product [Rotaria sp. Silwood2]|nr:unnamed protein product [Rotaria sp. Silwood2]CAF2934711.1 unnamed protein product [Rotaria sp. Silwood2]CAF4097755.1 unnamed protein product [Rotaria sp. Silwood2]CAF4429873.1 unnamed protein product [Rotaria sp. Silwood2]CAF4440880.1 unnamed protein product [Rotaria sp. Silwood2]